MLVNLRMGDAVSYDHVKQEYVPSKELKKEHTYIVIAGLHNNLQLNILKKNNKINVLFKGPVAVNKRPGHGRDPRNTIMVFELKE